MECAKNTPNPSGASSEYATCTYPPLAAIDGPGLAQPNLATSTESTIPGFDHVRPESAERDEMTATVESPRSLNQAAYHWMPSRATATLRAHRALSTGSAPGTSGRTKSIASAGLTIRPPSVSANAETGSSHRTCGDPQPNVAARAAQTIPRVKHIPAA